MYDSKSGSVGAVSATITSAPAGLNGWYLFNSNATTVYLQIFDAKSKDEVILGTTTPVLSLGIPAGSAANVLVDCVRDFLKGIVIACTLTRAGNTAPANTLDFNLFFCGDDGGAPAGGNQWRLI
jgi:hypothetical protein